MSDQLNSSNEEGSGRRVTRSSRAGTADPPASEPRKLRQSVDREMLSQSMTVTSSPRRPIRSSRRLSTDTHEDTPPVVVRTLRNRRVSVDRESATGTPKLPEDSSENESKPMLRRSRRISVDTATSTPTKRGATVLEPVSENAEKAEEEVASDTAAEQISPVVDASVQKDEAEAEDKAPAKVDKPTVPGSPSIRQRFGTMVGNFIDKIPLKRHSFSMNSDSDATDDGAKKGNKRQTVDLNKTVDKNFKMDAKSPKKKNQNVSSSVAEDSVEPMEVDDASENEEQEAPAEVEAPKKSQVDRFLSTTANSPKARQSLPAAKPQDSPTAAATSPNGTRKSPRSNALNRSLDKNFKSSSSQSVESPKKADLSRERDVISTSLSLVDEDEVRSDVEEAAEEEVNMEKTEEVVAKRDHTTKFMTRTVTTRHSIVTTTVSTTPGKQKNKKAALLNQSLDKDFKSTAEDKEKSDTVYIGDEETEEGEGMNVSLVASSDDEPEKEKEANTSVKVSPRKSLKAFREDQKTAQKEAEEEQQDKSEADSDDDTEDEDEKKETGDDSAKETMIQEILNRTKERAQKQANEEEMESEDEDEKNSDTKSPAKSPSSPQKKAPVAAKATTPKEKQNCSVMVERIKSAEKSPAKSPKKAAVERVPQDEEGDSEEAVGPHDDDEDNDEEWEDADEEEGDDDDDDEDSSDGSVCEFEMEDVIEDIQPEEGDSDDDAEEAKAGSVAKDNDNDDDEGESGEEEEEEEDVVINTRKLKNAEPPTKVSDILNKCQDFLKSKTVERKQQHEVDEEKRQRKKELKEAKKRKREAEEQRKKEALERQRAQKELMEKRNKEMALQRQKEEKKKKAKKPAKDAQPVTAAATTTTAATPAAASEAKPKTLAGNEKLQQEVIKKLGDLYAMNMIKKDEKKKRKQEAKKKKQTLPPQNEKANEANDKSEPPKKKLKILQATTNPQEMAKTLQKPKAAAKKSTEDDYVPKKKPELIPDKKYHQLAKDQKKEQNRLKKELLRQQGKSTKPVVKEPMRVLPKPVWTTLAGDFVVEDLVSPVKRKKDRTMKRRLATTTATDFHVEVIDAGDVNRKPGNFKEQMMNRKDIRREDSHNLLKRRKLH